MDYDFGTSRMKPPYYETQTQNQNPPHVSMFHRQPSSTSSSTSPQPHISSLYPKIGGQPGQPVVTPPSSRAPPYYHHHNQQQQQQQHSSSSSSGTGIRVHIKPEYRITPPPQLLPQMGDIPRSTFQFDFDFERKLLAEAEKGTPNWGRLAMEYLPSRKAESVPSVTPGADPVVSKYIASGLNREAVPVAVANFGDNPTKVREFANGYTLLREMGFSSNNVAEALLMFDNDTDKALAHFLNNSS